MFIHDAGDEPAHGAFVHAHRFARGFAVRRNHHLLVHSRAVRINRDDRRTFGLAVAADRLADHQTPRIETRMFPGRNNVAFDTRVRRCVMVDNLRIY